MKVLQLQQIELRKCVKLDLRTKDLLNLYGIFLRKEMKWGKKYENY